MVDTWTWAPADDNSEGSSETPGESTHGPGTTAQTEIEPGRLTRPLPLTFTDLLEEVKGRRWERFVPNRRMPPNPDRIVNKQVTNDEEHANLAPAAAGTITNPAAYIDPLIVGKELGGQREPLVVVHVRDVAPEKLFFVRTITGAAALQILGRDTARRSALIVNEDAANSVSLATRLEHCTASGSLTFTLGPGRSLTIDSISEVWAVAVAGTPAISVATETG